MTPEFVYNRLPLDVTNNNERFVKFIQDYYRQGLDEGVNSLVNNFKDLMYQKKYSKDFEERTIKSFGIDISLVESSQVRTELLYKLLNEFLETRGTKTAFEILFRMMFNKQVEIIYPREKLLNPTNATYLRTKRILISGTYPLSTDSIISGITSKSTAAIESFLPYYVNGVRYYLVKCNNLYDNFVIGEPLTISSLDYEYNEIHVPLISVSIVDGGRYYKKGDKLIPSANWFDGEFEVASIEKGKIDYITIVEMGEGYKVGETITLNQYSHFKAVIAEVDEGGQVLKIRIQNKGYNFTEIPDHIINTEEGEGLVIELHSNSIGRVKSIALTQGSVVLAGGTINYTIETDFGEGLIVKNVAVDSYLDAEYINRKGFLGYNATLLDSYTKHSHSYDIISEVPAVKYNNIVSSYANPSGYVYNKIYSKSNTIKLNTIEVQGELIRE